MVARATASREQLNFYIQECGDTESPFFLVKRVAFLQ